MPERRRRGYLYQTLQGLFFIIKNNQGLLKNNPWRVWYKYPDNGKSKELKYFWEEEQL